LKIVPCPSTHILYKKGNGGSKIQFGWQCNKFHETYKLNKILFDTNKHGLVVCVPSKISLSEEGSSLSDSSLLGGATSSLRLNGPPKTKKISINKQRQKTIN
jgi:hypothetical protein